MASTFRGLELQSTIMASGELRVELTTVDVGAPASDEVVVQVEATPINPSDLLLLLGPADPDSIVSNEYPEGQGLSAKVPTDELPSVRARIGQPIVPGNEGAGIVVAAGSEVQHLFGERVGMRGGGMFTQYRKLPARDCMALPQGATSADGASMFVNPLTALGIVETLRTEGHDALIHFAAASNLGRMLNRICIADGISLINVVRSAEQASVLADEGAEWILDSSASDFETRFTEAVAKTGATICFDPIGGGRQASIALAAMEAAASQRESGYSRYGTDVFKQVYVYGLLDQTPTVIDRWVGFAWSVGGWLLTPRLRRMAPERVEALRQRVVDELQTTFRTSYTRTLTLREALSPDTARAFNRKATGEKYLITPHIV